MDADRKRGRGVKEYQMEPFTLREATVSDANSVAGLHIESWRNTYRGILPDSYLDGTIGQERQEVWRRLSSSMPDRQLVVLAMHLQAPIGFVCVLLDEEPARGACLDNLHVLSRYLRPGDRTAPFRASGRLGTRA